MFFFQICLERLDAWPKRSWKYSGITFEKWVGEIGDGFCITCEWVGEIGLGFY